MFLKAILQAISGKKRPVAFPGPYHQLYLEARARTLKWQLSLGREDFSERLFLSTEAEAEECARVVSMFYQQNDIHIEDSVAQCWRINMFIKPALEKYFNAPLVLTFGSIETSPDKIRYDMSEKEIKNLLKERTYGTTSINLHAWLTLPSMEILDLTFVTSYAVMNNLPDSIGGVVYGPPENLNHTHFVYRPKILGEEFVEAAGLNNMYLAMN